VIEESQKPDRDVPDDGEVPQDIIVGTILHPPGTKQQKLEHSEGAMVVATQFSGPLPPPAILEYYDQIHPGAADRIIKMAEEQGAHRRAMETIVIKAEAAEQNRGPILGFILAMTSVLGGIWLISKGLQTVGLVAVMGAIAAPVGVFIYGKYSQQKELDSMQEKPTKKKKNRRRR